MKTVNKGTMFNALDNMRKALETKPYKFCGFEFLEELAEDIDHRAEQLRLGFLKSAAESIAYHEANPSSEFIYLGDDYLQFIKENPD